MERDDRLRLLERILELVLPLEAGLRTEDEDGRDVEPREIVELVPREGEELGRETVGR